MTSHDKDGRRAWDGKTQALVDRLDALLAARRAQGGVRRSGNGRVRASMPGTAGRAADGSAEPAARGDGDGPGVADPRRFFR